MGRKVQEWVDEIQTLSDIGKTQPHAAYVAFTHGLCSKWNYALCVTDLETHSASELLQPLEASINSQLIPALTGQNPTGDLVCQLLALPTHLGGLGLINPVDASAEQHHTSKLISAPLVNLVVNQELSLGECHATQQ